MNLKEIKTFYKSWKKANLLYNKTCPNNKIGFPEPLMKKICIQYFDNSLIRTGKNATYDFIGNVELKSSVNKGCTPFSKTQSSIKPSFNLIIVLVFTSFTKPS